MATKRKARSKRAVRKAPKAVVNIGRRKRRNGAVKTHRRRRSGVGSTAAAGRTTKRRKRRSMGSTSLVPNKRDLTAIFKKALGIAAGIIGTQLVIKPLERKILEKWPQLQKFLAAGEILLGGMVYLRAKSDLVKGAGIGLLATGVSNAITQFDIIKHIPGVHGSNEYSTVRIPMSGPFDSQLAGLINDGRRDIYTDQVAGLNYTDSIAGLTHTNMVAGDWDEAFDMIVKA